MSGVSVTDHAVTLTGPDGELSATFLPAAGMVCSSLRYRGEELLAQRHGLAAYLEHGTAFALPLLYPWANRLSRWAYAFDGTQVRLDPADPIIQQDPDSAVPIPIHGVLAACRDWELLEVFEHRLHAELDYSADRRRAAVFPFPHRLALEVTLSATEATVTATVTPSGERRVPISFGFHPFLTLPGSDRRDWELEGPVPGLSGRLGERSFDDGHSGVAGATFAVADHRRRIELSLRSGYTTVQIFSPPGGNFVCFEPMTAPVDALVTGEGLASIAPGQTFAATFAVRVSG